MTSRLLMLAAVLVLSACAQPALVGSLDKDCDGRVAMSPYRPNHIMINTFGFQAIGVVSAYDPFSARFNLKASDCARAKPAQPPRTYDLDKVGGTPEPGGGTMVSDSGKPCPRSRV